jgi:hypothetical protein
MLNKYEHLFYILTSVIDQGISRVADPGFLQSGFLRF